jgi:hypothetical protein
MFQNQYNAYDSYKVIVHKYYHYNQYNTLFQNQVQLYFKFIIKEIHF